jgi:hypothetical protein
MGIFLHPVEEVLPHAFTNIIVEKTREAIFLAAFAQGRSGDLVQPLLEWDEDVFVRCLFYFVACSLMSENGTLLEALMVASDMILQNCVW